MEDRICGQRSALGLNATGTRTERVFLLFQSAVTAKLQTERLRAAFIDRFEPAYWYGNATDRF